MAVFGSLGWNVVNFITWCVFVSSSNGEHLSTAPRIAASTQNHTKIVDLTKGVVPVNPLKKPCPGWKCPRRCACAPNSKTCALSVDCTNRKLSDIPDIPPTTTRLLLSKNRLTNISSSRFSDLKDLVEMDLSKNLIKKLETDAFRGLSKLESLYLQSNLLDDPSSVEFHTFAPLTRLTTLCTGNNCKSEASCRALVREISTITSLKYLVVDGYPGMVFNKSFGNLTNLTSISCGGSSLKCNLQYVTKQTFSGLANCPLETVELNDCNIKQVEPGSFSTLVYLRSLSLSYNRELCHNGWRNVTIGLNKTRIESLGLDSNCVDIHPDTHTVSESDLSPLFTTQLLTLDLHHCNLQVIEPGVIARALPTSLRRLILYNNDLNNGVCLLFLPWLTNLEYLDISIQNRYHHAVNLRNITIHDVSVAEAFGKACRIKYPIGLILLPNKLRILNASNLNLEYAIPPVSFHPNNSLEVVDGAKCLLSRICGKVTGLHHLKFLNFSNNRIINIGHDAFSDMPNLEDLNLSGNPMGGTFDDDLSEALFQNLTMLNTLDLSSTVTRRLPAAIFSGLKSLRVLKLGNNALETLQFHMDAFVETLQLLDVSNNSIKFLPDFLTSELDRIANPSWFALLLSNNKLWCNCQYLSFTKWLANTRVNIVDRKSITCRAQNASALRLDDLSHMQVEVALDCVTWIVLTACIAFFLCSITFLSLVAALYRQRWKLRYLYYASLKRSNPYMRLDDHADNTSDVYLSFDEAHDLEDGRRLYDVISVRVVNALQQHGITAKIREDMLAGKSLNSEISSVIQQSNKTVIFLSCDYCKEFWNTFEFNMAAYDGMYTNRKTIIPVIVGQVGSNDLLPEMNAFLDKEIVISFDVQHFDEFIEQLVYAISK